MKGLDLPVYLGKVSPEEKVELDAREAKDKAYTSAREQKIVKRWSKLNNSLRKTADYLQEHFTEEIDLEKMSEEIDVAISVIKINIDDLNFWHEFGYRMKRIRGKKDWVKSIKKDLSDTERYLTKKARTIASMEQVYGNISDDIKTKQKEKLEERQKQKAAASEEEEEIPIEVKEKDGN